MSILDDSQKIKNLDKSNMIGSIEALGDQLRDSWEKSRRVALPENYKKAENIVVTGMGGSAIGPHFARSVFDITLPLQIINEYYLPYFVNDKTLVIASSYSGSTEETISAAKDAIAKKAMSVAVATGGDLIELFKEKDLPFYQFEPKFNPSGQPRMATGYSIGAVLGLLDTLGFIKVSESEIEKAAKRIEEVGKGFSLETGLENNKAKKAAQSLNGKIPIVAGAQFLAGNAHIFANQLNENAKVFANYFLISEMNHHLLEGIKFPKNLGEKIKFIFLETHLYLDRIGARFDITKDVLTKAGVDSISYKAGSTEKVETAFEMLAFSSWVSFYLAIAYDIDPSPIPNVDYFKDQLSKLA